MTFVLTLAVRPLKFEPLFSRPTPNCPNFDLKQMLLSSVLIVQITNHENGKDLGPNVVHWNVQNVSLGNRQTYLTSSIEDFKINEIKLCTNKSPERWPNSSRYTQKSFKVYFKIISLWFDQQMRWKYRYNILGHFFTHFTCKNIRNIHDFLIWTI